MTDIKNFKNFPVTWDDMHRHARALAWRLADNKYSGIIGITRGGMVPATIIARELDIRLMDTICIASYDHQEQGDAKILKEFHGDGKGWLIIDDLVDTGKTANIVRTMVPNAHFSTLYAKPQGKPLVDSYVMEVSQDTWILFPWDLDYSYKAPIKGD